MQLHNFPIRKFLLAVISGAVLSSALLLVLFYLKTGSPVTVLCGIVLTAVNFAWGAALLIFLQGKLADFTNSLCQTLNSMMDGSDRPPADFEAETSLSRINHRLDRLYNIMLNTRRQTAEDKARLQSLMSDISHQTRTPIANLKLINDTLLTRDMPSNQQRDFLQTSVSQLDKLDFLIQAMVKTSRLETGVITLEKKQVPVADTLTDAINGILVPLEKKQIELDVDCPEGINLLHDSRWTAEAVYNLLDNAVKYTPAGGRIQVTVHNLEMFLRIDVADTGRGIPESKQAAVFKRFYREEAVHDVEGIGIGLYLTREIITMQGGFIRLSSTVGEGSVFSVYLPKT